jgi:hypothetical protein
LRANIIVFCVLPFASTNVKIICDFCALNWSGLMVTKCFGDSMHDDS